VISFAVAQADTVAPTVTVTAPSAGASIAGTVTVSASATDNLGGSGVAGVQFLLDGADLGSEDTIAPYSISWNSIGTSNGAHTLSARVRDAAGNAATATGVSITVANTTDTIRPTDPTGLTATASGSGQITLAWIASTDSGGSGLAGYRVERCQGAGCTGFIQIATPVSNSYVDGGLTANTFYNYRVRAVDGANNLSLNYSNVAGATTVASVAALVAAYGFNEGTGATVGDQSGNNNAGTVTGATWNGAGRYGNSLTFNGATHGVLIPASSSLNLSTALTVEAWVYPTVTQSGWRAILQREVDAYLLHAGSDGGTLRPTGGGIFGGNIDYFNVPAANALAVNTWSHIALTWDGATMRLYVNGVQAATKARTGTLQGTAGGAGPVHIGSNTYSGENFLGRIDEVRIYNRALTAAEITTDMNTPIGP
jgi:hypothetical protein